MSQGRGAPEIDVIEAERNKLGDQVGQVVSQSAQFAPFTHDYLFSNATSDEYTIYDSSVTTANTYRYARYHFLGLFHLLITPH